MRPIPRMLWVLCLLTAPAWASAQPTAAGNVVMATGAATASTPAGEIRALEKGSAVFSGETLHTAPGSFVNVKFSDGSYTLLRPGTRLEISAYAYTAPAAEAEPASPAEASPTPTATPTPAAVAPAPTTAPTATPPPLAAVTTAAGSPVPDRAFLRLLKGGFRAVSGAIGKLNQEDYRISTPVATIGIRGTQPFVQLVEDDSPFIDQMGLPEGLQAAGGAIIGTFTGEIEVETRASVTAQVPGSVFTGVEWTVAQALGRLAIGAPGQTLRLTAGQFIFVDRRGRSLSIVPPPFVLQTEDPSSPSCN
jgi:hypothetical protein